MDDQLRWSATVENTGETAIVVGDWAIPIQFNENLSGTAEEIYQRRVVDHSFVGMDSSYLYATPVSYTHLDVYKRQGSCKRRRHDGQGGLHFWLEFDGPLRK